MSGFYTGTTIQLSRDVSKDGEWVTRFRAGTFYPVGLGITIHGKTNAWDYPNQTAEERGSWWGIDRTFVHEWGHHLQRTIDIHLGRSSYITYELSESFAETVAYVCHGSVEFSDSFLDWNYQRYFGSGMDFNLRLIASPQLRRWNLYDIGSLEACLVHQVYHSKFDRDKFLWAMITAYQNQTGPGRDILYPIYYEGRDTHFYAPWVGAGQQSSELNHNRPILFTKKEFLEELDKVYDCGLGNRYFRAEAKGKVGFEY